MVNTLAGIDGSMAYDAIRRVWETTRQTRDCWLSTATVHTDLPWADRADSLAHLCLGGKTWGDTDPAQAALPRADLPAHDMCCVCLEDYDDPLPAAAGITPTAEGLFACRHVVCRECAHAIQNAQNPKCPLCRQPRLRWVTPWS